MKSTKNFTYTKTFVDKQSVVSLQYSMVNFLTVAYPDDVKFCTLSTKPGTYCSIVATTTGVFSATNSCMFPQSKPIFLPATVMRSLESCEQGLHISTVCAQQTGALVSTQMYPRADVDSVFCQARWLCSKMPRSLNSFPVALSVELKNKNKCKL